MRRIGLVASLLIVGLATSSGLSTPDQSAEAAPAPAPGVVTTFHVDTAHTGYSPQELAPPLRVAWTHTFDGATSYPLVGGGRIYVAVARDAGDCVVQALRTGDGSTVWTRKWPYGTRVTTALDGNRLYALTSTGTLMRLRADTGGVVWRRDLRTKNALHFHSPPTAEDGWVYVGAGGQGSTVIGVAGRSGAVRWRARARSGSDASPTVADHTVYVDYSGPQVYAFDATSGERRWHAGGSPYGGGSGVPTVFGNRVYVRGVTGLVLDTSHGRPLQAFFSNAMPAVDHDHLVTLENGVLHGMRRSNHNHRWFFRSDDGSDLLSSPVIAGGNVYVASAWGTLYAVSLSSGRVVWRADSTYAPLRSSPGGPAVGVTPGAGKLLVTDGDRLVAYDE